MKYLEFVFRTSPASETVHDVLAAVLAEVGFDSFVPEADKVSAYISAAAIDEDRLREALAAFPIEGVKIGYERHELEDKDWNSEWERNFYSPMVVDGRCVVCCSFHTDVPEAEYKITINPRMSFGTGHHATTRGIMRFLLRMDVAGRRALDMGCGTSILAILARMRGASSCLAIDNDPWCVENSRENIRLNGMSGIDVAEGDASALAGRGEFGLIVANITRNVLLADMGCYASHLSSGGDLLMSGFYTADVPVIRAEAERLGLRFVEQGAENNWAAVRFAKP